MFNSNKTKQKYALLIKVLLVVASSVYILVSINQEKANFEMLLAHLEPISLGYIFAFLGILIWLSLVNWYFEILKWKTLVNQVANISMKNAARQSLIAHAVAVLTPNRIGDFAAKLSFFEPKNHKRILGLNTVQNFTQLFVTLVFGIMGFAVLRELFWTITKSVQIEFLLIILLLSLIGLYLFKTTFKKTWQNIKIQLQVDALVRSKILFFSCFRYLIFSHQYYLIGLFLGWDIAYVDAMPCIFIMYLIASILPSIFIVDAALKAGIGIFVFSFFGVSSYVVLSISLIMWLFNFMFPAMVGNIFLLKKASKPSVNKEILSV